MTSPSLTRITLTILLTVSTNFAHAKPGFYSLEDPSVPPPVQQAADSVFEIFVLNALDKKTVNLTTDGDTFEAKVKAAGLKPEIETIIRFQIQYCRDHGFSESCDIYPDTDQGTAFLVDDGKTLWTNYHVVEDFVESLAELFHHPKWIANLTLKKQNLPVFLFNRAGQLVFAATTTGGRATVTVKPFSHQLTLPSIKGGYNASSDFVQIKISQSIGKPLALATTTPKEGDEMFLLGYPAGTGKYMEPDTPKDVIKDMVTRTPAPDSDGKGLKLMMGNIQPVEGAVTDPSLKGPGLPLWQMQSLTGLLDDRLDFYQLIVSDSDTTHGASGGAMLNAQGQLLGMNAGGGVTVVDGKVVQVTQRGIMLPEVLRKLRAAPQP